MSEKFEKVVKGLECCILRDPDDEPRCDVCLYEGKCTNRLKIDALALIRQQAEKIHELQTKVHELQTAQTARVMDADEIVLTTDPSKWLWVERKGEYCAEAFKAGKTVRGLIAFDSETPGAFLYCEHPDEYGKVWRCWTSRPTDDQRKAVKWE